ncbi:brevican core protein-like [Mercenaria mercenaria]|uniref:brevican core protein-like n=1 Tax=Mercenaria mercenaria TaxID=6596 RepID=UPI00234F92BF|nr:brevican core protein-like [Mercenaria mercenaria]
MAAARHNGGYAKVHGNSCYELVPARATWQYAEQNFRHKGGHLVHVSTPDDENFVMQFFSSHNYKIAVWTELNDINHEENFWWSSGDKFVYAKWMPGRKSNFQHHNYEDYVVLVPYLHAGFLQTYGQWDDVNCKQMYPWICEYGTDFI